MSNAGVVQRLVCDLAKVEMAVRLRSLAPLRNLLGTFRVRYINLFERIVFFVFINHLYKKRMVKIQTLSKIINNINDEIKYSLVIAFKFGYKSFFDKS